MSSMKIAMYLFHTFRNDHRVLKEARSLLSAGHEVVLIALREGDELPRERVEDGIRVLRLRIPARRFRKGRYAEYFVRAALAGLSARADAHHCHDLDTLVPAALASCFCHKPLIYDSHELFTETHFLVGREKERRIWAFLEKRFIRFAARVLTVSDPIADDLAARYGIERPLVVRNCPEYRTPPPPRPFFEDAGGEPVLLCQGYLQKGRGLETLVGAMRHVPRGRLVLLGDGEMKEELARLVALLHLEEKVTLLPAVPIEELPSRTASATLGFVLYSTASLNFRYALPNKFFEYVMAGVPVVSSRIPEIARLIEEHGVGRIVDPVSPETVAREVNRLLEDPDAIARMRENCLRAARVLHWGVEEKKLLSLYEEIASRNRK
ncbi:MAG: glycosyltransferase family 4 protein [Candidatus Eisenbacteria bacterium]|nr:glycosyltransferase family 4 protein [Candidatus Eisenbacteria bacterium]